jgi:hypothetical protein
MAGVFLLALAAGYQMWALGTNWVWPRAIVYWSLRSHAAWERSAILSEGEDFFVYVSFLRDKIPESGKVVLPPHTFVGKAGPFTFIDFMQYFLLPRQVLNCGEPAADCARGLTGPNSYLLRIGSFPPPEAASQNKDYVPFQDEWGLYVPR